MSNVGSPIITSLIQAAQAQQTASKTRDLKRAESERTQRFADQVELRVAGVESSEAVRQPPQNDSEQAGTRHQAKDHHRSGEPPNELDAERPHVDVKA